MDLLRKKLKGGTLVETLVAMVVIMLSFTIAVIIFSNVIRSSSFPRKVKAETLLKDLAARSKADNIFLDASFQYNGMQINKKVSPYAGSMGLSMLNLEAVDADGKRIAVFNELVLTE